MLSKLIVIGAALLFGGPTAAFACQLSGNPVLDDNFKTPDPGWGRPDEVGAFVPGGLALTPSVNGSAWRINRDYTLSAADWCVEIVSPAHLPEPANEQTVGDIGIWFWGRDAQNFYTATISLDGTAAIDRLVGGKWQTIVVPTRSPAVRAAPGAVNEIEIVVKGNAGSFFVNGTRIVDFHGEPPTGGGFPGVYGESGSRSTTWLVARTRLY